MRSPRALVHACAAVLLTLMSCSPPYEGAQCRSIGPLTDPKTLPLGPIVPATRDSLAGPASFFNYTTDLACCIKNPMYKGTGCSGTQCDEVLAKTTAARVDFKNDFCGPNLGNSSCTVFMQGSQIVGVYAFCAD